MEYRSSQTRLTITVIRIAHKITHHYLPPYRGDIPTFTPEN